MAMGLVDASARPLRSLIAIFILWKALLLLVALAAPPPDYDSSTSILFKINGIRDGSLPLIQLWQRLCIKLTRWDAIYFLSVARRGYLWEQEWAWGVGWTQLIALPSRVLRTTFPTIITEATVGIMIAHISHLASALVVYQLAWRLHANTAASFVAACLHIFAPAGIFLSAPYGESTFALFNFAGMLLYTMSGAGADPSRAAPLESVRPWLVAASGISFGLATSVRSNGLLNGLIFATHILRHLPHLRVSATRVYSFKQCVAGVLGGISNALGFALPQALAYEQFCYQNQDAPEWCSGLVPVAYSYVQRKYWNVGLFRYWEVQNIPLFLMAAPSIALLLRSALASLTARRPAAGSRKQDDPAQPVATDAAASVQMGCGSIVCRQTFALPQLVLAILAPTSYHVQILTRLASGYVLPYIWLAERLQLQTAIRFDATWWWVRWMIIWAVVQAGLFASFLPPA